MPGFRLATTPLDPDAPAVAACVAAAGAHGVYVANALAVGESLGFSFGAKSAPGLCWCGPRGNLVVIAPETVDGHAVAEAVLAANWSWRIAMGPAPVIDALRGRLRQKPVVHRDQVYYRGDASTAARPAGAAEVRAAVPADRDRLVQATLALNHSDLQLDPARVDRRWLYDTIDERIRDGTTRVLGPAGSLDAKLDLGSQGPAGVVVEGVFTFPHARGRGLATALVASALVAAAGAPVFLHVGHFNQPARTAYERAGMAAVGRCRLLLRG